MTTVQWRKSSYTGGANDNQCVELGRLAPGTRIAVRDSKNPDGGHLTLTTAEFTDLIEQITTRT
ncbi:uncharacterized protein DUF397 [Actinomadura hallensis]|uniref:Uncharacterized protein DUF397 n=1 Tax=Actinomadura hallensis TaxID=337895 RepID=A0A543I8S6_9ACTN|nr:DUF397 domain-containing protein [Actinomadura hallensis]MDD6792840.1 DUF397 domain-containing protein [Thermobifida fusca]TQM66983.1 uncharacterized protein DUF397 [Actinomadura hallensis]